jgi:hypothetical protein
MKCRVTVTTAQTNPGISFENCKKLKFTQQPLKCKKIRDCSVIHNLKGFLVDKRSKTAV